MDTSYRAYVTDTLMGLSGAEQRWADIFIDLDDGPKKPQQTADEIKDRLLKGLNGGDES